MLSSIEQNNSGVLSERFSAGALRYIKLGKSGSWAKRALRDGNIPFGYRAVSHELCAEGKWDEVNRALRANGWTARGAGQGVRELKEFYTLPDDTLWVTLADGHLWWTFANGAPSPASETEDGPSRVRCTRAGWSNASLTGAPLTVRSLSSSVTRTAGYRMTLCSIEREDYLLRRIQGVTEPLLEQANATAIQMRSLAAQMIRQLHWEDFETMVDLVFSHNGWRRQTALGKDQPDVDLVVRQALTKETAWIQVKSKSNQSELDDYLDRFRRDGSCDRFFFICHSPTTSLNVPKQKELHVLTGDELAQATLDAGLYDWLLKRTG